MAKQPNSKHLNTVKTLFRELSEKYFGAGEFKTLSFYAAKDWRGGYGKGSDCTVVIESSMWYGALNDGTFGWRPHTELNDRLADMGLWYELGSSCTVHVFEMDASQKANHEKKKSEPPAPPLPAPAGYRMPPDNLKRKLELAHAGLIAIPKEYVEWHREIAEEKLAALPLQAVIKKELKSDGSLSGVDVLHAKVVTKGDKVLNLVYHTFNQGFMKQLPEGGATFLSDDDLK